MRLFGQWPRMLLLILLLPLFYCIFKCSYQSRQHEIHVCFSFFYPLNFTEFMWRQDLVDVLHLLGRCHTWGTLSLGNPNILKVTSSKPAQPLPQIEPLSLFFWLEICSLSQREKSSLISKTLLYRHSGNDIPEQSSQCFLLRRNTEVWEIHVEFSPNILFGPMSTQGMFFSW